MTLAPLRVLLISFCCGVNRLISGDKAAQIRLSSATSAGAVVAPIANGAAWDLPVPLLRQAGLDIGHGQRGGEIAVVVPALVADQIDLDEPGLVVIAQVRIGI